jgi:hypothetical protein
VSFTFFTDRNLGHKFPDILRAAGLNVEEHDDHFGPTTPDVEWIAAVASRNWIAVSRDERIRYKPNERRAVFDARLGLLLVIGNATHPELAMNFVRTAGPIMAFLSRRNAPFIAKVYRPSPAEVARNPQAAGRIDLWLP